VEKRAVAAKRTDRGALIPSSFRAIMNDAVDLQKLRGRAGKKMGGKKC